MIGCSNMCSSCTEAAQHTPKGSSSMEAAVSRLVRGVLMARVRNRCMPLLVIGGISSEEAAMLGEGRQSEGYLTVATLYGGVDRRGADASRLWDILGLTTGAHYAVHVMLPAERCPSWSSDSSTHSTRDECRLAVQTAEMY